MDSIKMTEDKSIIRKREKNRKLAIALISAVFITITIAGVAAGFWVNSKVGWEEAEVCEEEYANRTSSVKEDVDCLPAYWWGFLPIGVIWAIALFKYGVAMHTLLK